MIVLNQIGRPAALCFLALASFGVGSLAWADAKSDAAARAAAAQAQQAAAARAQQAAAAQAQQIAAARAQQAAINKRNADAAAKRNAEQAAINRRNADAAAARNTKLRSGPAEKPKQILSKDSGRVQLDEAAKGPGQAAKVFDGRKR